jgi:glycerol kinase
MEKATAQGLALAAGAAALLGIYASSRNAPSTPRSPPSPSTSSNSSSSTSLASSSSPRRVRKEDLVGPFIGALDQGTSSTRFIIFDSRTQIAASHQLLLPPLYPKETYIAFLTITVSSNSSYSQTVKLFICPAALNITLDSILFNIINEGKCSHIITHHRHRSWVEHSCEALLDQSLECIDAAVREFEALGLPKAEIKAIGITNQRETSMMWDKVTGRPLYNAIGNLKPN